MTTYIVELRCPRCDKTHRVSNHFCLNNGGPNRPGSMADLYAAGELPSVLVGLLQDMSWCKEAGEYVLIADAARLRKSVQFHGVTSLEQ